MYYIITNGKYWVIENPIRPGEYMESTKSSNAKQFTFKQAKNLLNARSKKLGWIRNGYSMVGEDGNKPTVSPKAKGNGGVFLNENDIVVDLNLLDQIEDECTKFLSLAAWDESELSNMLESLSTYLSKLDSEESDIKHALVIYTYKHDGKLPQAHVVFKDQNEDSIKIKKGKILTARVVTNEDGKEEYEVTHKKNIFIIPSSMKDAMFVVL